MCKENAVQKEISPLIFTTTLCVKPIKYHDPVNKTIKPIILDTNFYFFFYYFTLPVIIIKLLPLQHIFFSVSCT